MKQERKILVKYSDRYDFFRESPPIDREILLSHLYPPLPVRENTLVWGFSILREAGRLNLQELKVVEINGTPADFLCLALKLENRMDSYSWLEQVKIARFIRLYDCSSRLAEIEELIQTTGSFLKRVDLFEKLESGPKNLVLSSYVDLRTAAKLKNFSETACSTLIDKTGNLSVSEKRKLANLVNETGLRDKLDEDGVLKLVKQAVTSSDPPGTAFTMRYPSLTSMETTVRNFQDRYLKGTGLQLALPPAFEGDSIQVSFRCRSQKEFEQRVERLKGITGKTDELFDLLF